MKFSLRGSRAAESHQPKKKVPNFPLIQLDATEEAVTVKAPGISKEYPRDGQEPLDRLSERVALETTEALGLTVCKVKATDHTSDDEPFFLVADTHIGELQDYEMYSGAPGQYEVYTHPASEEKTPLFSLMGSKNRHSDFEKTQRFNKRTVGYVAAALMLAGAVLIPVTGILKPHQETVQEQYQPNPAQLPVEAPAGWGTYAAWKTPINSQAVPYAAENNVLVASGNTITARESETGEPRWDADAGIPVTSIAPLGKGRVAVTDGKVVKILDLHTHAVQDTDLPSEGQVTFGYGAPLVTVSSSPVMYVLEDSGTWAKRTIPAGSKVAGAHDGAVTAVNYADKSTKIWSITEDTAELPVPEQLKGPEVQGCTGANTTMICFSKEKAKTRVSAYSVDRQDKKTTVKKGKETVLNRGVSVGALMTPTVDHDSGYFLAQGIWVTNKALVDVGAEAHIGGGYAFRDTTKNTEKLNASGDVVATGPKTRAYPAAVSQKDTAIVVAADPASPSETYVYALPTNHKE